MGMEKLCGWLDRPAAVATVLSQQQYPLFGPVAAQFRAKGSGKGKRVLLYEAIYKTLGGRAKYNWRLQGIGDCVSMGGARAVDILKALQVVMGTGSWHAETATEVIYALSRVEIGKGQLGNGDGSVGAWAMEACKLYGTLDRRVYGKHDLTKYSAQRAKTWGGPRAGLPDELEPTARQQLVRTGSLVQTWEDVCDAVAAGYPVTIASNCGFDYNKDAQGRPRRDKDGFLRPAGSWPHQMCIVGIDDKSKRPGACIDNSWGPNWLSGPIAFDQPEGSFWVDAEELERRILRQQDSWAYSDYMGFPVKTFDLGSIF